MRASLRGLRVVVTGGAGFIGSALCRYLIGQTDAHVLNLDKLTYAGNLASLAAVADHPRYQFQQVDIGDHARLVEAFGAFRPDIVMHLAAESHVDRSISGSRVFLDTNVIGTHTLLETARSYFAQLRGRKQETFRLVHVSTDEVYGSLPAEGLFTETTMLDPHSPYSASKAAAEHLCNAWHHTYGLPIVISNSSNNYGPFHYPEKLIPLTILNALEGKPLPVYGRGLNVRDWLYVDDHVRGLILIATKGAPGQKYNVGGRNERSNIAVVLHICALLDAMHPRGAPHSRLITFVADRPGHDARYAIDPTRLETDLGWKPQESFETGIEKTTRWFIDNRRWWRPLRPDPMRLASSLSAAVLQRAE